MQKYNDRMLFAIITTLFLGDMLFLGYILHELYNWDTTIIAGIIGFVGAVIGGAITYYGVNKTLRHRDRELFLETATEKLIFADDLIQIHKEYLNTAFVYENFKGNMDGDALNNMVKKLLQDFYASIQSRNAELYKSLEYDEITIILLHQKSIAALLTKKFGEEERKEAIEKIRNVFNVFLVSKSKLENNYFKYKKQK